MSLARKGVVNARVWASECGPVADQNVFVFSFEPNVDVYSETNEGATVS